MRLTLGLLVSTVLVSGAHAADYLRGMIAPPTYSMAAPMQSAGYDWSGFHIGATGDFNIATFSNQLTGSALGRAAFPNTAITDQVGSLIHLSDTTGRKAGFSIFGGYSSQWDDVVVGIEGEYSRVATPAGATVTPIARTLNDSGGTLWDVDIKSGGRRSELMDYGVLRGRVGAAYGRFLPFVTAGLAYGRITVNDTLTATAQQYQSVAIYDANGILTGYNRVVLGNMAVNYLKHRSKNAGGWTIGAGVDYALTDNILLRAQWQMLQIGSDKSASARLNSFKIGGGIKF